MRRERLLGMQITNLLLAGWKVLGISPSLHQHDVDQEELVITCYCAYVWVVSPAGVGKYSCPLAGKPFNMLQNELANAGVIEAGISTPLFLTKLFLTHL